MGDTLSRYEAMARRARPKSQNAERQTISAIWVPRELKAELMEVSQATGDAMSRVVRTFVAAHAGRLPLEYERHKALAGDS